MKKDEKFYNQICVAKMLKDGVLYQSLFNRNEFFRCLIKLSDKCKFTENDSKTEKIFKAYCLCGNMADCIKRTGCLNGEISDTLFFKKSEDIEITLLAKSMYVANGTKYKEFLEWQVNVILEKGEIDIKEEYRKWRISLFGEDEIESIDDMIKEIDFD